MAAHTFAMEATTMNCASLIDRGADDYMLETAMLKVFSTDALWQIVNDTMQIYGGQGYFSTEPYERMMRDARINQIGEGANEVLKAFIAVVGMRGVGESLKGILDALHHPLKEMGTLWRFGKNQLAQRFTSPEVPVHMCRPQKRGRAARRPHPRIRHRRPANPRPFPQRSPCTTATARKGAELAIMAVVLKSQYMQERLADAACDLYASSCTLARLDHLLTPKNGHATDTRPRRRSRPLFPDPRQPPHQAKPGGAVGQ